MAALKVLFFIPFFCYLSFRFFLSIVKKFALLFTRINISTQRWPGGQRDERASFNGFRICQIRSTHRDLLYFCISLSTVVCTQMSSVKANQSPRSLSAPRLPRCLSITNCPYWFIQLMSICVNILQLAHAR